MKQHAKVILIVLYGITVICGAQSQTNNHAGAQETQARGYWIDPSTGLMWAAKDNGDNITWGKAMKYCQNLNLAGYSAGGCRRSMNCKGFTTTAVLQPRTQKTQCRFSREEQREDCF